MCGLHRLLNAQRSAESGKGSGCIVFTPVEASIDGSLGPFAEWLEEGCNRECRYHNDQGRLRHLPGKRTCECLEHDDKPKVDQRQQCRQGAVDQGTVDNNINVEKAMAQDSYGQGDGEWQN